MNINGKSQISTSKTGSDAISGVAPKSKAFQYTPNNLKLNGTIKT